MDVKSVGRSTEKVSCVPVTITIKWLLKWLFWNGTVYVPVTIFDQYLVFCHYFDFKPKLLVFFCQNLDEILISYQSRIGVWVFSYLKIQYKCFKNIIFLTRGMSHFRLCSSRCIIQVTIIRKCPVIFVCLTAYHAFPHKNVLGKRYASENFTRFPLLKNLEYSENIW